jgi:nucleotide-binding universal stress UspA family protein
LVLLSGLGRVVAEAEAHDGDLIIVGHRATSSATTLLGSTADRFAHHAHCPGIVGPLTIE